MVKCKRHTMKATEDHEEKVIRACERPAQDVRCLLYAFNDAMQEEILTEEDMVSACKEVAAELKKYHEEKAKKKVSIKTFLQTHCKWNQYFSIEVLERAAGKKGYKFRKHKIEYEEVQWEGELIFEPKEGGFAADLEKRYVYIGISDKLKDSPDPKLAKLADKGYDHACALHEGFWIDCDDASVIDMFPDEVLCPPEYFYPQTVLEIIQPTNNTSYRSSTSTRRRRVK